MHEPFVGLCNHPPILTARAAWAIAHGWSLSVVALMVLLGAALTLPALWPRRWARRLAAKAGAALGPVGALEMASVGETVTLLGIVEGDHAGGVVRTTSRAGLPPGASDPLAQTVRQRRITLHTMEGPVELDTPLEVVAGAREDRSRSHLDLGVRSHPTVTRWIDHGDIVRVTGILALGSGGEAGYREPSLRWSLTGERILVAFDGPPRRAGRLVGRLAKRALAGALIYFILFGYIAPQLPEAGLPSRAAASVLASMSPFAADRRHVKDLYWFDCWAP